MTIQALQLPTSEGNHASYVWMVPDSASADGEGTVLMKRVEDVVLKHLADNGYPQGEGEFLIHICRQAL